ncbi:MAG: Ig-like domain-containing protein [Bacteroidetes bacterium]|nr:Ig-like domain-containing protein [Bacteroidota bacterium]
MMAGSWFFNLILPAILLGVLVSCANVRPPRGGPKDTIPPLMIASIPFHESLNFEGDEINIQFHERIIIADLNNKLIITPRLDEEFDYKTGKYDLTIILNEKLKDSTTYTFNFADAVKDITEGNPAENAVIAFSTGNYLDSLIIQGTVIDLLTAQPIENSVVAIYELTDTLDIFSGSPRYFTRTNESGVFKLENIKNVQFEIYAFIDNNRNLQNESSREKYGFLFDPIDPDVDTDSASFWVIPIQKLDISELELIGNRSTGKYYELAFSKPLIDYTLTSTNADTLFSNFIDENRGIRIYQTFSIKDSLAVKIQVNDSIGFALDTLFYLQFQESKRKPSEFKESFKPKNRESVDNNFEGIYRFNKPITTVNTDSLFIELDSLAILPFDPQKDLIWDKHHTKLTFKKYIDPQLFKEADNRKLEIIRLQRELNKRIDSLVQLWHNDSLGTYDRSLLIDLLGYDPDTIERDDSRARQRYLPLNPIGYLSSPPGQFKLFMARGSFITADNDSSAVVERRYSFKNPLNFGIIRGSIVTSDSSFFIQLLNEKFKVIQEIVNQADYEFRDVPPGKYFIRILQDKNNNGKWDFGNILEGVEPEPVIFYPDIIPVKKNWELENELMVF